MADKYQPDDLITAKQAAEATGYHRRTILTWIRNGWLPAGKGPGPKGRYSIRYSDLMHVANHPFTPGKKNGS